jgi:hypothetical protein
MNLMVTIFGGIVVTALLYGLGRRAKLSNFWAAVVAAGLPSVAYIIYAIQNWSGLDVLTIHVVAFPTVAILLSQLYGEKGERPGHMHWAPKLLITFFVLLTMLLSGFVYIAGQGLPPSIAHWVLPNIEGKTVHTGFAGAVVHGEDAAKSIAHYRRMDAILMRLGWQVEVQGLDALKPGVATAVRVQVRDKNGDPVDSAKIQLAYGRPGQTVMEVQDMPYSVGGGYSTVLTLPVAGAWLATLTLEGNGEKVILEHELPET